jgi:hypothetical protein
MWKRLLAAIFGLVGLIVWKRFLGDGEAQSAAQDTLAGTLQKTWAKSGSMSGREFEHFMADMFRTAGYKVDGRWRCRGPRCGSAAKGRA